MESLNLEYVMTKLHVCIDLGHHSFKLAAFAKKGRRLILLKHLVEKIDFTMGDSFKEAVPAIVDKIGKMLSSLGIKPKRASIYLSLPGPLTFSRLLKLPVVDRGKVPQIVQYEAQQEIPFPLEEVIWDYQVLGNPNPEHLHVLLVAVRQEWIQELLAGLGKANIQIERIETSPLASFNCLRLALPPSEETIALINLGARSTNLAICAPNTLWVRTMNIGGDHVTDEIQRELKLSRSETENLKQKKGTLKPFDSPQTAAPLDKLLAGAMEIPMKRLLAELTRSIGFYNNQFHKDPVKKIYLTGGSSRIEHLESYLAEKLAVPIEHFRMFQALPIETAEKDIWQRDGSVLTEVVGLALRLFKAPIAINLVSKSHLAQRAMARKRRYWFFSALVVIGILAVQIFFQGRLSQHASSQLARLLEIQKQLAFRTQVVQELSEKAQSYSLQIHEIQKLIHERSLWSGILEELQDKIPMHIWLKKLTTSYIRAPEFKVPERSKGAPKDMILVTLSCTTTGTYKDVSSLKDSLEASPWFKNVQIRSANPPVEGERDFVMQMETEA